MAGTTRGAGARTVRLRALADACALVLFVVVGLRAHHEDTVAMVLARNAIPLLVAWFVFSALFGAYRRPGAATLLRTWIVAVPVALVVRSVWVGSPTGGRFLVFLAVGLAFTLLFLVLGRAIVAFATRRGVSSGRRGRAGATRDRPRSPGTS
jgi:hypothetical protein